MAQNFLIQSYCKFFTLVSLKTPLKYEVHSVHVVKHPGKPHFSHIIFVWCFHYICIVSVYMSIFSSMFYETTNGIKLLPVLFKVDNDCSVVYCTGPLETFIDTLLEELNFLPSQYRTIVPGDLNLNQLLEGNINLLQPILTEFNQHQHSTYTVHIDGAICGIEKVILFFLDPIAIQWRFVILTNI